MVVAGVLALALALPTGALFGIGYGTGVRIGYEQIYPLLFPANTEGKRQPATAVKNVQALNDIYNAIGGKEASQMGIAVGLSSAMSELDKNPDFLALLKLESSLSGSTLSTSEEQRRLGRGTFSQQAESLSEVEQFNLDNPSDVEKLDRYRGYTITQLRNIIISTTNAQSKRLATKVLNEKLQKNQGTGKTTSISGIPQPAFHKTSDSAWNTWNANFQKLLAEWNQRRTQQKRQGPRHPSYQATLDQLRDIVIKLRRLSNDYRNPNNNIRTSALLLRKQFGAGHFNYR